MRGPIPRHTRVRLLPARPRFLATAPRASSPCIHSRVSLTCTWHGCARRGHFQIGAFSHRRVSDGASQGARLADRRSASRSQLLLSRSVHHSSGGGVLAAAAAPPHVPLDRSDRRLVCADAFRWRRGALASRLRGLCVLAHSRRRITQPSCSSCACPLRVLRRFGFSQRSTIRTSTGWAESVLTFSRTNGALRCKSVPCCSPSRCVPPSIPSLHHPRFTTLASSASLHHPRCPRLVSRPTSSPKPLSALCPPSLSLTRPLYSCISGPSLGTQSGRPARERRRRAVEAGRAPGACYGQGVDGQIRGAWAVVAGCDRGLGG